MNKTFTTLLFTSFLAIMSLSSHADSKWVVGNGSCSTVCGKENSSPVQSGIYVNGNPFYICRANAQGEGKRAGYNLKPTWSPGCFVGWGGRELKVETYECLCVD